MSFSLKELSCLASLSERFCSKLRQDHFSTAKTISQDTQQPEKHHSQVALHRCHAMKEYCLVLKHYAARNAKYFPYLRGCERAAGTHWSPTTTQGHAHGRTSTANVQTCDTHPLHFKNAHDGSISRSTRSPQQQLYGEANNPADLHIPELAWIFSFQGDCRSTTFCCNNKST